MAKDTAPKAPETKALSPDEEAELKKLEEEEVAKKLAQDAARIAAESEIRAKAASAVVEANTKPAAPGPVVHVVGDIPVTCLKDGRGRLGDRVYEYVKGREIEMHPDHAKELEDTGWVARVNVIGSV